MGVNTLGGPQISIYNYDWLVSESRGEQSTEYD